MGNGGAAKGKDPRFEPQIFGHIGERLSYGVGHMRGWRQFMQDASIHINGYPVENHYLFGVLDGHGGPQVALYVQRHFSLELYLNPLFKQGSYAEALIETFNKMDFIMQTEPGRTQLQSITRKQIAIANRSPEIRSSEFAGCTANICYVTDRVIYVANAGDSRSVASVRGRAVALSYDHKPHQKSELKRIRKAGGYVSGGRVNQNLNLTRSLGDLEYKNNRALKASEQIISSTPDLISMRREGVDFILMGCDGIWESKSNEEMIAWVASRLQLGETPEKVVAQLMKQELADDGGQEQGTDNMTAILIKFSS